MTLPSPAALLSLPKFSAWYPGQERAFADVMTWMPTDRRFMCLSVPTGSGKSLIAVLASRMSSRRVTILTATKGLQAQIMKDFAAVGMVDIRGQNSFQCILDSGLTCDEGPCHEGYGCEHRDGGCLYYDRVREATLAPLVVTNYAYWLAQTQYGEGLGPRGLLVMDEAHLAFSALESHLATHIGRDEVDGIGAPLPSTQGLLTWDEWRNWASRAYQTAAHRANELKADIKQARDAGMTVSRSESAAYRRAASLERRLGTLRLSEGRWISERQGHGWTFTPLWPKEYASRIFLGVPKILAMSAILTEKTADYLDIPSDRIFLSMPSLFPVGNTPVVHVPTVRMNHRATPEELRMWVDRIDQVIDRRQDRKGIIFTVSYQRRNMLLEGSRHKAIMFSHGQKDVVEMVNRFRAAPSPAVLVSPAVTSGWDFPGTECEYIIVGKLPYPDTTSELVKERTKDDADWPSFLAMETLIQEAGRGTRSETDRCEVLVLDDNWRWFWMRYRKFAPPWFHQRVKGSVDTVPSPPDRKEVLAGETVDRFARIW